MTRGSSISSRRADERGGGGAVSAVNSHGAPPIADAVDPLTRRLRRMYGAIAEEPIPDAIAALLQRLTG